MRTSPLTLVLLAGLSTSCSETSSDTPVPAEPAGPRTVVLISIDTLRADRLGTYGGEEGVSPAIDALARDGVVFEQALATSPWTLPSHMSMLTGLDPVAHGVHDRTYHLSTAAYTLAEALQDDGFATGAFTDGGFVAGNFGFAQGFDVYDDARVEGTKSDNGFARLLPGALDWLDERLDSDVFLFLHTFDVHAPFHDVDADVAVPFRARATPAGPDDPFLQRARYVTQQRDLGISDYATLSGLLNDYDAGVHVADRGVADVVALLKARGRYEDALIIVTSDHGEAMFEHQLHVGHGITLYDSELHIPLVVKLPRSQAAGQRDATPVDLTDIAPTILDHTATLRPSDMTGGSLLDLVRGRDFTRAPIFAMSTNIESYALVDGSHKYISAMAVSDVTAVQHFLAPITPSMGHWTDGTEYSMGVGEARRVLTYDFVGDPLGLLDAFPPHEQLFDREQDPAEQHDIAKSEPERVGVMRRELLDLWDQSARVNDVLTNSDEHEDSDLPFNPNQAHALAMLGYLDTGARTELRQVPQRLRKNITEEAPERPDMTALFEQDRIVHALRRELAAGQLRDDAQAVFQAAGDACAAWAADHPQHTKRVIWRLFELGALAREAGYKLDVAPWRAHGIELTPDSR